MIKFAWYGVCIATRKWHVGLNKSRAWGSRLYIQPKLCRAQWTSRDGTRPFRHELGPYHIHDKGLEGLNLCGPKKVCASKRSLRGHLEVFNQILLSNSKVTENCILGHANDGREHGGKDNRLNRAGRLYAHLDLGPERIISSLKRWSVDDTRQAVHSNPVLLDQTICGHFGGKEIHQGRRLVAWGEKEVRWRRHICRTRGQKWGRVEKLRSWQFWQWCSFCGKWMIIFWIFQGCCQLLEISHV